MGARVREKPPGSGEYWVFINHRGRRKAVKVGSFKTAKKVAEQITARIKLGQPIAEEKPSLPTIAEYWDTFQGGYLQSAVRESTAESYEQNFRNHILPTLGKLCLDEVTAAHMETFVASLVKERRLAKATIGIILRQLCRLFSRAIKHKLVTENPASRLAELYSQAPVRHEKIEPLTPQEVPLFLKAVRINKYTQKHYALFLAAIHTGLRAGELLALEWPDIDWRNKRISVERGYDRVHMKVVPTKTKKHRQVDLSDGIYLLEFLFLGGKPPPKPYGSCGLDPTPDDLTCDSFPRC